ncbi:MAG: MFS transporter, partial [Mangrovimonas sp.]|nr:MFS transporter [Mangrovimonas sp.]
MNANTTINKNFLIVLLGILAALGPFTIDMYLPGFKQIALDLRTDEKHVAFTLTSYFVGIAVGQLFYGPIVDKYGRKRPLLFGLFIYALSALGCAFSPSIQTMIGMRLLQALGGCVGMVAANAIISDVYEVNQRAKAFSTMILIMGVAPLVAPSIGSFFVEQANWQYIFYFLT